MTIFVLTCIDKPNSLELRMATRPAHLAYMAANSRGVKLGGPFLDAKGDMTGSMILIEADDISAVEALTASDPYALAGLFERVEIRAWRPTIGQLP